MIRWHRIGRAAGALAALLALVGAVTLPVQLRPRLDRLASLTHPSAVLDEQRVLLLRLLAEGTALRVALKVRADKARGAIAPIYSGDVPSELPQGTTNLRYEARVEERDGSATIRVRVLEDYFGDEGKAALSIATIGSDDSVRWEPAGE